MGRFVREGLRIEFGCYFGYSLRGPHLLSSTPLSPPPSLLRSLSPSLSLFTPLPVLSLFHVLCHFASSNKNSTLYQWFTFVYLVGRKGRDGGRGEKSYKTSSDSCPGSLVSKTQTPSPRPRLRSGSSGRLPGSGTAG